MRFTATNDTAPDESFAETVLPGFKRALLSWRAIRMFDGEPLPEDVMRDCLRDALLAPSSSNLQPFELYWVRDSSQHARLVDGCLGQPAARTAGDLVVVIARRDLWKSDVGKVRELMADHGAVATPEPIDDFYREIAPRPTRSDAIGAGNLVSRVRFWLMGLCRPSIRTPLNKGDHRVWAHIQASLAAQTLMLSITAHGYDSCPIGGIDKHRIRRMLALPNRAEVTMVVAAGRRRPERLYGRRNRLPNGDMIKEV